MQLTECEPVFHTYEKALEKYLNFYSERQDALNEEKMASIQTKIYIINVTGMSLATFGGREVRDEATCEEAETQRYAIFTG